MANVVVSREAQKDLASIRRYIRDELRNPDASRRVIAALKKGILSLASFENRGQPLDALISVHTEYRYLICENYCVFYPVNANDVLILRVLHQRQDCLNALFMTD